jgi:hypothetical protein
MTIKIFTYLLLSLLVSANQMLVAQQTPVIEVRGRVVEMINGKAVGIPKVTVSISNTDSDITEADGSFTLYSKSGNQKFVRIAVTSMDNRQLLAPIEGLINIPPSTNIEVLLCSQQNEVLKTKVSELNTKVKALQSKYSLSARQVQILQREMVDTILFYEQRIQEVQALSAQQNAASKSEIQEKDKIIKRLEADLRQTMQQLLAAKDEQFLQKQTHFKSISTTFRQYLDALYNMRDMLLPDRVSTYFINEAAINELGKKINAYNAARDALLAHQDAHITAVQHYWKDSREGGTGSSVKEQVEATYTYILTDVHDRTVYPAEFTVNETIKKYTTRQLGRQEAQKKATQAAKEPCSRITVLLPILEEKINNTINSLKQDF